MMRFITIFNLYLFKRTKVFSLLLFIVAIGFSGCKKFLDEPSSKQELIPETLEDLQALMEGYQGSPDLLELLSDNYYVTTSSWQSILSNLTPVVNNEALHYIWEGHAIRFDDQWRQSYQYIYYSNVVLDLLPDITAKAQNPTLSNTIKGTALFKRGFYLHLVAQLYCRPYSSTASTDPGLPLRLTPDINEVSVRPSVEQTYAQIISDLEEAAALLPTTTSVPTRPNKAAAYGALARVYLSMRDYTNAGHFADLSLAQNSYLLDYNSLNPFDIHPIPLFNKEVLFHSENFGSSILGQALIDTILYASYNSNDLRKGIFFRVGAGGHVFHGSYGQLDDKEFTGIATDEVYLIRAESYARGNNKDSALYYLNTLLETRWDDNGSWAPYMAVDAQDALNQILMERRKELVWRGLRWSDLRRFNLAEGDGANITLTRIVAGNTYTLPPNDLRWVVLIPQDVINFSGIEQNPR